MEPQTHRASFTMIVGLLLRWGSKRSEVAHKALFARSAATLKFSSYLRATLSRGVSHASPPRQIKDCVERILRERTRMHAGEKRALLLFL